MTYPNDRMYCSTHEWLLRDGDTATIGITDYAQRALGDITFVDLPKVGTVLKAGDAMGSVESVKAVSDIYAPAAGTVVEVNSRLEASPELANKSPHGDGWLARLKLSGEPSGLMTAEQYAKSFENE